MGIIGNTHGVKVRPIPNRKKIATMVSRLLFPKKLEIELDESRSVSAVSALRFA
jgi:hypothetical protein